MWRAVFHSALTSALFLSMAHGQPYECFQNSNELRSAVDLYLRNDTSRISTTYGPTIGSWCVGQLQDFRGIFSNPNAMSFNEQLDGWDMSAATTTADMFKGCESFNQDVSMWDMSNVESIAGMFFAATKFNQSLDAWNTSSLVYMNDFCAYCTVFESDLSSWDTSKVINMGGSFNFAEEFNGDISSWDVSKVVDMSDLFWKAVKFNADVSKVREDVEPNHIKQRRGSSTCI